LFGQMYVSVELLYVWGGPRISLLLNGGDVWKMPTISVFYGIVIKMFFNDHAPPHFHAEYAEFKATVDIRSLQILEGQLPRRALDLVLDWAELHREELLGDWNLCRAKQAPKPIAPLM